MKKRPLNTAQTLERLSRLVDSLQQPIALICLHGQLKLSGWLATARLSETCTRLHYAGDFDPEGLMIAQNLLRRYPEQVRLWRMSTADYQDAKPEKPLSHVRLAKLQRIDHPALLPIRDAMERLGKAAYQESLLPQLINDLQEATATR